MTNPPSPRAAAEERDRALAYVLVRLVIGASFFGHGLVRMPKLNAFHAQLMGEFKTSILPEILVSPIGYALSFVELAVGALLLAGAMTWVAAVAGGLVMIILVFGSTTIEHFNVISDQLIHASLLAAVLTFRRHNTYSVDHIRHPQQTAALAGLPSGQPSHRKSRSFQSFFSVGRDRLSGVVWKVSDDGHQLREGREHASAALRPLR